MAYQPKNYRKFVATAATATLVASAVAPLASAATVSDFTDVAPQYQEAVSFLLEKGASNGKTETQFGVYDNIIRQDAAVQLVKVLGLEVDLTETTTKFTDVPARTAPYVNALVKAGITSGKTETTFGASDNITRGELAIWIQRGFELEGTGSVDFTDVASQYQEAVSALKENGVTQGINETQFGTYQNATRGDYAIFLMRADAATQVVKEPAVKSVTSLNATQLEVVFNTAVDAESLLNKDGSLKATVTVKTLDGVEAGALKGTLSEDGKTLTVTAQNSLSKRYDVVVDGVKTTEGQDVAKYAEMITIAADKTAPTIVSTTKVTSTRVKVTFSEPIKSLGNVTYKLTDGTVVTDVTNDFTPGAQEVTFTLGDSIKANAEVLATFIGAQDQAGNLLTPNPATVSLVKGEKDGVAPTVTSITQLGASKFVVKFSEQLQANPAVMISGNTVSGIEKDANDATKYIVTTGSVLDGATTVVVSNFTDLSGEQGTTTSKVVSFVKDTAASKVVSSAVVVDEENRKEYLELTFDKDVVLAATATVDGVGSHLKDYVTTPIGEADLTATTVKYKSEDSKKVIRVELDAFLGATDVEGAVYTLELAFAGVTSEANVDVERTQVTFTRGKDGVAANTAVVKVTSVKQGADNNKVVVTFDQAVDGATATNVNNYQIDGAVVESVTLNPVSGGTQVAVLNLKAGSNQFTGARNITIENVKALGSTKVMETYFTNTVSLKENVAPTVVSATFVSTTQVKLTFSEAVSDAAGLDFEVLVGGNSQATAEKVNLGATKADTTATLTIDAVNTDELAKGISLKGLDTLDIVDAAGNKLSVPTNVTVVQ